MAEKIPKELLKNIHNNKEDIQSPGIDFIALFNKRNKSKART